METRDLVILIIVVTYATIRLYMKYGKKKTVAPNNKRDNVIDSGTDYEPYSGKRS